LENENGDLVVSHEPEIVDNSAEAETLVLTEENDVNDSDAIVIGILENKNDNLIVSEVIEEQQPGSPVASEGESGAPLNDGDRGNDPGTVESPDASVLGVAQAVITQIHTCEIARKQ
jgi:hypothetical protein